MIKEIELPKDTTEIKLLEYYDSGEGDEHSYPVTGVFCNNKLVLQLDSHGWINLGEIMGLDRKIKLENQNLDL